MRREDNTCGTNVPSYDTRAVTRIVRIVETVTVTYEEEAIVELELLGTSSAAGPWAHRRLG